MDWSNLSGVLTGVLGIAVIVTGGLLGLQIGTVRTLRDSNGDLRARVSDLEKDRAEDKATIAERDTKIAQLTLDNEVLSRVVTGEAQLVSLGHLLDEHHTEAREHWETDEQVLTQILAAISRLIDLQKGRPS